MSSPVQSTPADLQAEALARDIASDMPSPYCPGRSIASCPSQAARELEDDILDLAHQGMDKDTIESVLVKRFGEEKMGSDTQSEVLVAILIVAVLALVAIVTASRKWLRPSNEPSSAKGAPVSPSKSLANVSADELDRLEDELDDIDGL